MPENKYLNNLELIEQSKNGDKNALEELVGNNIGLVRSIALRFRDRGVEYEDLVQIGSIGIIKAIKSFDRSYNTAFSTYAVPMIIGEIKRFLRDDSIIKISRDTKKRGINIMRIKEDFKQKHNREPHTSELAAVTGLSPEDIIYALDAISPVYSLQDGNLINKNNKDGGENENALENYLSGEVDEIESATNKIALKEALDTLPEMQRELIILRYFKNLSQQQTAKFLGITQVKVSREEKKIFQKLKELLV
ncbi:MAG: sigma-70 family RNA polymerase sigma factor [Oscillospiraceae bacterium]|nr:sigma-70 family RNA polymerase sigma factor [Oscillospiraceae bacterium]